jgi:hypothetical protein
VKNFREKHAATVIQRGWRRHEKTRDKNKSRQQNLNQVNTRFSRIYQLKSFSI